MATIRRLIVEVVDARDLLPKDRQGTSSPYAVINYYGQRKKTRTVIRDLNPTWNQVLEFSDGKEKPSHVFTDKLKLDLFHDKNYGPTRRNNFLGRIRLSSSHFVTKGEEALIYYPLEKKSLLSWVQGEIGLKVCYVDELPLPLEQVKTDPPEEQAETNGQPETPTNTEAEAVPALADAGSAHQAPPPTEEPKDEAAPQAPPPAAPENASAEEAEKQLECDTSAAPPPPQQEETIGGGKEVPGEDNSCFECNICLELANDPVVTLCGHLYCWPCIYEWLHVKTSSLDADEQPENICPVCKAKVYISSLVLLYGRGTVGKYKTFLRYFMMWFMMWLMTWLNFGS